MKTALRKVEEPYDHDQQQCQEQTHPQDHQELEESHLNREAQQSEQVPPLVGETLAEAPHMEAEHRQH
jgi:hypothetical protein